MEAEPFIASQARPELGSLLESDFQFQFFKSSSSSSSSRSQILKNYNPPPVILEEDIEDPSPATNYADDDLSHLPPPKKIHRCRTAPAMAVVRDLRPKTPQTIPKPQSDPTSLLRQAALLLLIYLSLGVLIYSFNPDHFSGVETHPVVDALYFCIVTMCTIGYGDIAPSTPPTKVFACFFVLVGFGFIDILLSGVVNYVLDLQESMILTGIQMGGGGEGGFSAKNYIVDVEKGRMRIRLKVGLALGVVVLCIGMGALILYFVEELDWIDSIYLSVMSVTTVGYGDKAFKTLTGRLLAAIWLLFSTLAVARAFLYLAEARIDKRHRRITKWVLHREITIDDLLAADINNNGFIRNPGDHLTVHIVGHGYTGFRDMRLVLSCHVRLRGLPTIVVLLCCILRSCNGPAIVVALAKIIHLHGADEDFCSLHRIYYSKSEYIIYKLKEMGKIGEKDILQICNQFNKLDPNNSGKITLPDLLEGHL
ncbi:two-pore potassium channel 5 isoform X1 [Actinidia eriantha]|uniref:two-pore potassium channel 5 isoform X1 n=1 Tax=Actinidia eriantha TaxID=165200 RepID=UPI0025873DD4|nr:two-pore potassium channel 5 isoform X1 [Actinidia eriantha]